MLDIDASLDQSFAGMHNAPRFMALEFAQAGADGEADFIGSMERRYSTHIAELDAWMAEGRANVQAIEVAMRETEFALEPNQIARFLRLAEAITARAEQSASSYAQFVKRLRKQSRAFAKYSMTASEYMTGLTTRIEGALGLEIDFLVDVSDHYRGLARLHDPTNERGPAFENADDLIAYLKTG